MATKASKVKVCPLHDRVIARRLDPLKSIGGILVPEDALKKRFEAIVVAVGPGRLRDDGERTPVAVKVGDHVFYSSHRDHEIEVDGETLVVIEEENLLAKIGGA